MVKHPGMWRAAIKDNWTALLKIRYLGYPASDLWSLLPVNGAWEVFAINPSGDE